MTYAVKAFTETKAAQDWLNAAEEKGGRLVASLSFQGEPETMGEHVAWFVMHRETPPRPAHDPDEQRPEISEATNPEATDANELPDTRTTRDGTPKAERTPPQDREAAPTTGEKKMAAHGLLQALPPGARVEWTKWLRREFKVENFGAMSDEQGATLYDALIAAQEGAQEAAVATVAP